jgi:hypothetical protein
MMSPNDKAERLVEMVETIIPYQRPEAIDITIDFVAEMIRYNPTHPLLKKRNKGRLEDFGGKEYWEDVLVCLKRIKEEDILELRRFLEEANKTRFSNK